MHVLFFLGFFGFLFFLNTQAISIASVTVVSFSARAGWELGWLDPDTQTHRGSECETMYVSEGKAATVSVPPAVT